MHTLAKHPFSAWCALLFAFCAALLCSGCAPISASVATPAPTPCASSKPAAAPAEPDYAALSERADAAFHEAFSIDFSTFMLPQMQYITDLMAQHDTFLAMRSAIDAAAHAAFAEAFCAVSGEYATLPAGRISVSLPSWQELMSLYRALGDALAPALVERCETTAELTAQSISLSVSFAPYESFVGTSGEALFSFTTLYAYLNTVYDDAGCEKEYVDEPLPEAYLATLSDPLPGRRITL